MLDRCACNGHACCSLSPVLQATSRRNRRPARHSDAFSSPQDRQCARQILRPALSLPTSCLHCRRQRRQGRNLTHLCPLRTVMVCQLVERHSGARHQFKLQRRVVSEPFAGMLAGDATICLDRERLSRNQRDHFEGARLENFFCLVSPLASNGRVCHWQVPPIC